MTIYLVRHAKAGSRRDWSGDDDLRPLSPVGHRQAERIADALADVGAKRIVSSPFVRCRQSLDPLAQRLRLPLELSDALAEGAPLTETLRLLDKVAAETTALCTHGDIVENVVNHLKDTGVPIDDDRMEKGSIWVLDTRDGEVVGSHYIPHPDNAQFNATQLNEPASTGRYGDRVRILVTNDDGVDAPGLKPLAGTLAADGHDVVVVAPTSDRSGSGAAIGKLFGIEPPEIVRHEWPDLPGVLVHALDAPPATAVLGAALGAFGDPPDLVASGINPGANTGHLVIHSGTVGAALTGAGLDIPGVAVSLPWSTETEYYWETAARFAAAAIEWVAKSDGGVPRVLNLNVPNLPLHEVKGVREAELAPHGEVWIASADSSGGDLKLEFQGRADAAPGTDVALIREGYVAVTPLMSVVRAPLLGAAEAVASALPEPSSG